VCRHAKPLLVSDWAAADCTQCSRWNDMQSSFQMTQGSAVTHVTRAASDGVVGCDRGSLHMIEAEETHTARV
jgi:hypothetical protein